MAEQPRFREWVVNEALESFLREKEGEAARLQWFFDREAKTADGNVKLSSLCGIEPGQQEVKWEADTPLKYDYTSPDLPQQRFISTYGGVRPDFQFWAPGAKRQLLVECKGEEYQSKVHLYHAQRYFTYLSERGHSGGVVYLVAPEHEKQWLKMGEGITAKGEIRYGVLPWDPEFLNGLRFDLVGVLAKLTQESTKLLEAALKKI
ncbi:MAG: hypothetical protein WB780_23420 [Candidatus Acidiferrales bacterium]